MSASLLISSMVIVWPWLRPDYASLNRGDRLNRFSIFSRARNANGRRQFGRLRTIAVSGLADCWRGPVVFVKLNCGVTREVIRHPGGSTASFWNDRESFDHR